MMEAFDISVYWQTDLLLIAKILGAATLGVMIGYERSYHGRAAGMRTYALVSVGSAMLLMIHGLPLMWFDAGKPASLTDDATRVIQGIVTGIGFLGAGVILKDGFSIRGLSTAASIWLTSAVGILVGVGFYVAAIAATLITMAIMSEFKFLEMLLPHQVLVRLELTFKRTRAPTISEVRARVLQYGFHVSEWTVAGNSDLDKTTYVLFLKAIGEASETRLADGLSAADDIVAYLVAPSRS